MADYSSMFLAEELRLDGSNFAEWYMRLREVLHTNNELYVIDEPLEERPDVTADLEGYMEWYERQTIYLKVQWLVRTFMNVDLGNQFEDLSAIEIVNELKSRFIAQVRIARFEVLDEFLSTKMEENTCLEQYLRKMHRLYFTLVDVWDYEMTDKLAIDGLLRSLPPSYKNYVRDYVMRGDSITFCEFVSQMRNVKVEPIAGEVVNAEGIF